MTYFCFLCIQTDPETKEIVTGYKDVPIGHNSLQDLMDITLRLTIGFDNVWWETKNGRRYKRFYFSLYSWRSASITAASMFGMSDDRIQALSGHASISEIGTYRRNELNRMRSETARMDYSKCLDQFKIPSYYRGIRRIVNTNDNNNNNNDDDDDDEDDEDDDLSDYDDDDDLSNYNNNNNNNNHNKNHNRNENDTNVCSPSELSTFFNKDMNGLSGLQQHNWLSSQLDCNYPSQSTLSTNFVAYPGRVQFNFHGTHPKLNYSIAPSQFSIGQSDRKFSQSVLIMIFFSSSKKIIKLMIFSHNLYISLLH